MWLESVHARGPQSIADPEKEELCRLRVNILEGERRGGKEQQSELGAAEALPAETGGTGGVGGGGGGGRTGWRRRLRLGGAGSREPRLNLGATFRATAGRGW